MANYLVTYDLRKELDSEGYKKLYEALRSYGTYSWPLESIWIVEATSANAILSKLSPLLDDNDGLLVVKLTEELCYRRVKKGVPPWLDARFTCQ